MKNKIKKYTFLGSLIFLTSIHSNAASNSKKNCSEVLEKDQSKIFEEAPQIADYYPRHFNSNWWKNYKLILPNDSSLLVRLVTEVVDEFFKNSNLSQPTIEAIKSNAQLLTEHFFEHSLQESYVFADAKYSHKIIQLFKTSEGEIVIQIISLDSNLNHGKRVHEILSPHGHIIPHKTIELNNAVASNGMIKLSHILKIALHKAPSIALGEVENFEKEWEELENEVNFKTIQSFIQKSSARDFKIDPEKENPLVAIESKLNHIDIAALIQRALKLKPTSLDEFMQYIHSFKISAFKRLFLNPKKIIREELKLSLQDYAGKTISDFWSLSNFIYRDFLITTKNGGKITLSVEFSFLPQVDAEGNPVPQLIQKLTRVQVSAPTNSPTLLVAKKQIDELVQSIFNESNKMVTEKRPDQD